MLFCCKSNARTVPRNYILLFIFTMTEAVFVSTITSAYSVDLVLIALVLTTAMVVGLTLYAFYTTEDFTMCGGFLFACCLLLIACGILNMFMKSKVLEILIATFSLMLYSLYLIYDT